MKKAALSGKPYAGNPHVRFDEGEVASAKPRRGSLLYKLQLMMALAGLALLPATGGVTRVSERFGFDAEDSTRFLQAALDSGVATVVVDRASGPWVTRPLFARSNQTVIFERGVELHAKRGEFKDVNDCLFTCADVTNVTILGRGAVWRMHRADYDAAPYRKGEWRNALNILSSRHVTVEGLWLTESGGDGVYVGTSGRKNEPPKPPSEDIVLRDLVCDRNYRQGMSIITARGLLIERCVLSNTWGTPPAAGIDLEPNRWEECLTGVVIRDCVSCGNQGKGFEVYLGQLNADSPAVDVRVERFRSSGNAEGLRVSQTLCRSFARGTMRFTDCTFERERGAAVDLVRKPQNALGLVFDGCTLADCAADVCLGGGAYDDPPTDGVEFRDCRIRQGAARDWITRATTTLCGGRVGGIRGTVTVESPSGRERLTLDDAWRRSWFAPAPFESLVPALPFDEKAVGSEWAVPRNGRLPDIAVRGCARYRFRAAKAGEVRFAGRAIRLGRRKLSAQQMVVRDASGRMVARLPAPDEKRKAFSVAVPASGFYTLEVPVPRHAFVLTSADVAVGLELSDAPCNLLRPVGKLAFRVTRGFQLAFSGDENERVNVVLRDPSGRVVWQRDGIGNWEAFTDASASAGLWTLEFRKPTNAPYEDCMVLLRGASPVLILPSLGD